MDKAVALSDIDRHKSALASYSEPLKRYGEDQATEIRAYVGKAMVNKAIILGKLNFPDIKLAACDEVLERFGGEQALAIRERIAAKALA